MKKAPRRSDPPQNSLSLQRQNLSEQMERAVERALREPTPAEKPLPPRPEELRDCQEWRDLSLLMRDQKPNCERCGIAGDLHVHHIEPLWKAPERLLDVTNLRVLCPRCHFIVEPRVRTVPRSDVHPYYLYMIAHRGKAKHVVRGKAKRPRP